MKKFESERNSLHQLVLEMAELAEKMVSLAVRSIGDHESDALVSRVHVWESRMDNLEVEIDKRAIRLLTVYSPVAHDLRFVVAASRISSELERVGDNAVNICESIKLLASNGRLNHQPFGTDPAADNVPSSVQLLEQLGQHVNQMVGQTSLAVKQSDAELARRTISLDDVIDTINEQVVTEQLTSDESLSATIAQVMIARSLERIADRYTNVCEEVVFLEDGDDIRHRPLNLAVAATLDVAGVNTV